MIYIKCVQNMRFIMLLLIGVLFTVQEKNKSTKILDLVTMTDESEGQRHRSVVYNFW